MIPRPGRQVLKVAILAEKYAVDYSWYVDTILNLIRIAGDYVSEEVWYRVLQIVTNRDDVQGYAAKTVFEVSTPGSAPRWGLKAERGRLGLWGHPRACILLLQRRRSPDLLGPPQGGGLGQWEGQQGAGCPGCSHWSRVPAGSHSLCPRKGGPGVPVVAQW